MCMAMSTYPVYPRWPRFCLVGLWFGREVLRAGLVFSAEDSSAKGFLCPPQACALQTCPRAQALFSVPFLALSSFQTFMQAIPYLVPEFISVEIPYLMVFKGPNPEFRVFRFSAFSAFSGFRGSTSGIAVFQFFPLLGVPNPEFRGLGSRHKDLVRPHLARTDPGLSTSNKEVEFRFWF